VVLTIASGIDYVVNFACMSRRESSARGSGESRDGDAPGGDVRDGDVHDDDQGPGR